MILIPSLKVPLTWQVLKVILIPDLEPHMYLMSRNKFKVPMAFFPY